MNRRWRAILILIGVMTLWGSVFVMTKDVIDAVPPLTLAFMRVAIGFLVLLPFALGRLRRQPSPRPPLPWRDMLTMGVIGVAFYYAVFNFGLFYTSASQGALVQSSIPAMTALVAMLWLGEPATRSRLTGIALSVVGVLVIFSGSPADRSAASPMLGNLLVFASVIAWGIYTSCAKRCAHVDAMILTAGVIGVGGVLLLPCAAIELGGQPLPVLSGIEWIEVVLLGAGASGVAYMLYNLALQDIDASQAGVFANLIPVVGVASGIIVLGDPISVRAIIGGLVVIAGVWITGAERTQRPVTQGA